MPDTARTLTELLSTLFADGQSAGAITPQDMRDLIVSTLKMNGSMVVHDNFSNSQTVDTTAVKVDQWTGKPQENGLTVDIASNHRITVPVAGVFEIRCDIAFSGTASSHFYFQLRKNGNVISGSKTAVVTNASGNITHASLSALVTSVANDYFELWAVGGGSQTLLIQNGNFSVVRVG